MPAKSDGGSMTCWGPTEAGSMLSQLHRRAVRLEMVLSAQTGPSFSISENQLKPWPVE